jgi:hypothetical protein
MEPRVFGSLGRRSLMAETKRRTRLDSADEFRMVWLEGRAVDWDGRDQGAGSDWVGRVDPECLG